MPGKGLVKLRQAMERVVAQNLETQDFLNEVVIAQNKGGVLTMTLLQMLIEEGLLKKEEVEKRVNANELLVLSPEGDCKISLSTLLNDRDSGGKDDEHRGSEETGS